MKLDYSQELRNKIGFLEREHKKSGNLKIFKELRAPGGEFQAIEVEKTEHLLRLKKKNGGGGGGGYMKNDKVYRLFFYCSMFQREKYNKPEINQQHKLQCSVPNQTALP